MLIITPPPDKKTRYTIDIDAAARAKLNQFSKFHKLTQGELIEVLMDTYLPPSSDLEARLVAKREEKIEKRNPQKELLKKLKTMSPEQLAAVMKAAEAS